MSRTALTLLALAGISIAATVWLIRLPESQPEPHLVQSTQAMAATRDIAISASATIDATKHPDEISDEVTSIRIEESFMEVSTKGPFSIYPEVPATLYGDNLDAALGGDARAQYNVALALHECSGVPDRPKFDQMKAAGKIPVEIETVLEVSVDTCSALFEQVPVGETEDLYRDWLRKAVEANDSLARSWNLTFGPGQTSAEDAKVIVLAALREKEPIVYFQVAGYLASYKDSSDEQYEAWMLFGCQQHPSCIPAKYEANLRLEYYAYQVDEILETTNNIKRSIARGDWDALAL